MGNCVLDPCVEEELWAIWKFIAQDNSDAATRVVEAAFETFKTLAENPSLGRKRSIRKLPSREIRSWRVSGFDNYLIFYTSLTDGIQVHHVYHGARNIDALFDGK
jgi:toxin ParE1/3/4